MEKYNEEHYNQLKELIFEIGEFYEGNDWVFVKKYALRYSHPSARTLFSTRDDYTKKQSLNKIEEKLIQEYFDKYNILLEIKK